MKNKSIDYDSVSRTYDLLRSGDPEMVTQLLRFGECGPDSLVLDIGCGTANNTQLLALATDCEVIGLDFSSGMLVEAMTKFPGCNFIHSPAEESPFKNSIFDFAYMTDVIHHISDTPGVIGEIHRILRRGGKTCIVTQSHVQIERRVTSRFFPRTVQIDQNRYPSISDLEEMLRDAGFSEVMSKEYIFSPVLLGNDYLTTVEQKGFSMLHKISSDAFSSGLKKLQHTLDMGVKLDYAAEYTFVLATK